MSEHKTTATNGPPSFGLWQSGWYRRVVPSATTTFNAEAWTRDTYMHGVLIRRETANG